METVWWLIKSISEKGLLYKGYTVQPYSPAAGSGLSSHELNQPGAYKQISDTSVIAQFKCVEDDVSSKFNSSEVLFISVDSFSQFNKNRKKVKKKNFLNFINYF